MTEQRIRYWLNVGTGLIHKSSCSNCLMTHDGHRKPEWTGGSQTNWWGPYQTLGAAIDVAITTNWTSVRLCALGCGDWPTITTPGT